MINTLRARLTLDALPYGASRAELIDAVAAALDDAEERGRVNGRLDILIGDCLDDAEVIR